MPALNHKGPMGQGPMTGRRMGRCTNFGADPKKQMTRENDKATVNPPENPNNDEVFFGRGFGFGHRRGGAGSGLGRQNRFRGGF